jgi:SAM-dependent methyltransferase
MFYSFDAMVHFDMEIVMAYIREAYRVVRPGGHAFLHYSNYTAAPGGDFRNSPHWRNFMSIPLFTHLALKTGFHVARSQTIAWGGVECLDGMSLLRKPEAA